MVAVTRTLAVPFMPFRLVSFPQIFSWLSSVQNSTTSHADVGTNNVMNTDLSGTTCLLYTSDAADEL